MWTEDFVLAAINGRVVKVAPEKMQDMLTRDPSTASELFIQILGQVRDNLKVISDEQRDTREKIGEVVTKVAVLEGRSTSVDMLAKQMDAMASEIDALKLRNAQQDGAFKLANFLKEYAPWLVALATGAWALFKEHPQIHQ